MGLELSEDERLTASAEGSAERATLEIEGRELRLTNLDRVLYARTGFTKRDLIDYYAAIAPVLLPHLKDRPVTMRRFPEGVDHEGFWEKHCPQHRPDWVKTAEIKSESRRGPVAFCLVNDLPTLIWVANLACVELHVSLATAEHRACPTAMVFDLDPGEPADLLDCADLALLIRDTLLDRSIESLAKVSGSKGIQIYVPLNVEVGYETTGEFAHSLARAFEAELPDRAVSKMRKSLRTGKVLIDWSQNSRHKTTVAVYSMRAKPTPSVSMPVSWSVLESALEAQDPARLRFTPEAALEIVRRDGDGFREVLTTEQQQVRLQ